LLFPPGANGPGAKASGIAPITPGNRMGETAVGMPAASSAGTARFMWLAHGGSVAAGLVFLAALVRTLCLEAGEEIVLVVPRTDP